MSLRQNLLRGEYQNNGIKGVSTVYHNSKFMLWQHQIESLTQKFYFRLCKIFIFVFNAESLQHMETLSDGRFRTSYRKLK